MIQWDFIDRSKEAKQNWDISEYMNSAFDIQRVQAFKGLQFSKHHQQTYRCQHQRRETEEKQQAYSRKTFSGARKIPSEINSRTKVINVYNIINVYHSKHMLHHKTRHKLQCHFVFRKKSFDEKTASLIHPLHIYFVLFHYAWSLAQNLKFKLPEHNVKFSSNLHSSASTFPTWFLTWVLLFSIFSPMVH